MFNKRGVYLIELFFTCTSGDEYNMNVTPASFMGVATQSMCLEAYVVNFNFFEVLHGNLFHSHAKKKFATLFLRSASAGNKADKVCAVPRCTIYFRKPYGRNALNFIMRSDLDYI